MEIDLHAVIRVVEHQRDDALAELAAARARVAELEAVVPEVQCPSCGTTIRARLADQPGAIAPKADR